MYINELKSELEFNEGIDRFRSLVESGDKCHISVNGVLIDAIVDVRVGNCIYPIILDSNVILRKKRFHITEIYE